MPFRFHGAVAPQVQPESGSRSYNWSENVWVKVIKGRKAEVFAALPALNTTIAECPLANAVVVDVKFTNTDVAYWTATIICACGPDAVFEEVERGLISRKIEYNPRYRFQLGETTPENPDENLKALWAIEAILAANDEADYNQKKESLIDPLTNTRVKELLTKRMQGQDQYLEPAPIARRTRYFTLTSAGRTGIRQTPSFLHVGLPTGYEWLKTCDRVLNRPGFLERIEEWTGAIEWDHDLYPVP